jgi:segregation and condensation protein B
MGEPERIPAAELLPAVGAIVFASDESVEPAELARALGVELERIHEVLRALEERCAAGELGLQLEWVAGRVRLATRTEVGAWVRRFFRERNRTRLSPAALETLAIIAYRQPVTAPEIQAIRGKDPTAALKGLVDKKLIRTLGRKRVVGNPLLYGTTRGFLEHFGLNELEDLPSIQELEELIEVLDERQAAFGGAEEPEGDGIVAGDAAAIGAGTADEAPAGNGEPG